MAFTPIGPFPVVRQPVSLTTPFDYVDNLTYLKLLESIRQYVNDVIDGVNEISDAVNVFTSSISEQFENFTAEQNRTLAEWAAQIVQFTIGTDGEGRHSLQMMDDGILRFYSVEAIDTRIAQLQQLIAAETAQREQDLAAETAAREAAISTETNERTTAIQALSDDLIPRIDVRQWTHMIDMVRDFQCDNTGTQPIDTQLLNAATQLVEGNGGTLYFPAGRYLITQQFVMPGRALIGGDDNHPEWRASPPVNFVGEGSNEACTQGEAPYRLGGTIFDIQSSPPLGSFIMDTWGTVSFRNLSFQNLSGISGAYAPFVRIFHTTVNMDKISFLGHSTRNGNNALQNGIACGYQGSTHGRGIFQGYGSSFHNLNFTRMRNCIQVYGGGNGIDFQNIVIGNHCGGSNAAAIVLDGTGDICRANSFVNVVGQCNTYRNLFSLTNATANTFTNVQAWDMVPGGNWNAVFDIQANGGANVFNGVFINGHADTTQLVNAGGTGYTGMTYQGNMYMMRLNYSGPGSGIEVWGGLDMRSALQPPAIPPTNPSANVNRTIYFNSNNGALEYWTSDGRYRVSATRIGD